MPKPSKLISLQSSVYNHEKKARRKYASLLTNPTIKKIFEQGLEGEYRIVVLGQSGVGKTTLILKLLGAKNSDDDKKYNLSVLSTYIRGSTVEGGAGTSTVFRYKISKNTTGCIKLPEGRKEFKKLNDLKSYLGEIRQKVESGKYDHKEPVLVELPCQYFYKKQTNTPWVITDLPGIGSNIISEHEYVNDLINAFILNSNVFLIVEKANNIGQLKSLKIPGYGAWQNFGQRCRLVVSHAFSADSFKKKYRDKKSLKTEELLSYYEKVLNSEKGLMMEGVNEIFPLDYGDSWENLRKSEKKLFTLIKEPHEEVEHKLHDSLNRSLNLEEEYLTLINLPKIIEKVEKEKKEKMKKLKENRAKIEQYEEEVIEFEKKIVSERKEKKKIEKQILSVETKNVEFKPTPLPWDEDWEAFKDDNPENHDENWQTQKENFQKELKKHSKKIFNYEEELERKFRKKYKGAPFDKRWRDYCKHNRDSYYHDYNDPKRSWTHWFWIVTYRETNNHAKNSHAKGIYKGVCAQYEKWIKNTNDIVNECIKEETCTLKTHITNKNRKIKQYQNRINYRKKKIDIINNEIKNLKKDIKDIKDTTKEDQSNYSKYSDFRTEELNNSVIKYLDKAKMESSPGVALQYLAFCNQIISSSKALSNS